MNQDKLLGKAHDPYDLWATDFGVFAKSQYLNGGTTGKILVYLVGVLDWVFPVLSRRLFGCKKRAYPIVVAHNILIEAGGSEVDHNKLLKLLDLLTETRCIQQGGGAWGLGFRWVDKRCTYEENIPFVTHTPYVMEALVCLLDL
ncbi:MAG: hypothetical protein OEZ47_13830, partial [Gammaproteobacteria bacterium]|nr:hypothetical protein [Gammaproteobacteria bacterium]